MTNLELIALCERCYDCADIVGGPDGRDGASVAKLPSGDVALIFRGTLVGNGLRELLDWLNDLRTRLLRRAGFPGRLHEGFLASFQALWPQVQSAVEDLMTPPEPRYWRLPFVGPLLERWPAIFSSFGRGPAPAPRLHIAGHSKGGALAILAGVALATWQPSVVTFGAPMVGDMQFAAHYPSETKLVCYQADGDIVPFLPLAGYRHAGSVVTQADLPWHLRHGLAHMLMADLFDTSTATNTFEKIANAHHLTNYRQWLSKMPPDGQSQQSRAA